MKMWITPILLVSTVFLFIPVFESRADDKNAADPAAILQQQQRDDYARQQSKLDREPASTASIEGAYARYRDATIPYGDRADDLIHRMSLEEKLQLVSCDSSPMPKYGIPAFSQYRECLHGVTPFILAGSEIEAHDPDAQKAFHSTVYPEPITTASSWDGALFHKIAHEISDEARGALNGKGSSFFGPNINIFRDPRWGRGQETPGEDPYLSGRYAVAFISGLQGDDPIHAESLGCAKHYAVHSGSEGDRFYFNANVNMHDLYDTYLPAFEAAVREAHVEQVMTAYNAVNGVPVSLSPLLVKRILRNEWSYDGDIITDAGALNNATTYFNFGCPVEDSALALNAGLDTDVGSWAGFLGQALKEKEITEAQIDEAVKHRLMLLYRLGRMDDPDRDPYSRIPSSVVDCQEHRNTALQAAREGVVLLKNDKNTLPLSKAIRSIALIGPMADHEMLGNYEGRPSRAVTIAQGLMAKLSSNVSLNTVLATDKNNPTMPSNLRPIPVEWLTCPTAPAELHATHGIWASYYDTRTGIPGGEVDKRVETAAEFQLEVPNAPQKIIPRDFQAVWETTITPSEDALLTLENNVGAKVSLTVDGKKVIDTRCWNYAQSISNNGGQFLSKGIAHQILLETTSSVFKMNVGQPVQLDFSKALAAVAASDVVVLACGITNSFENEFCDRLTTALPWDQLQLIEAVTHAAGTKPVIVVVSSGSSIAMPWAARNVPAILWCGAGGEEAGTAVADVLFGDFNPSGRLPITFYSSDDQLPPIENYWVEGGQGRTYRYFTGQPEWEFGYGLSYTQFHYSELTVLTPNPTTTQNIQVSVKVKNVGSRAGGEVCELYLSHDGAEWLAPLRSLQGFARIDLNSGEEKKLVFTLTPWQFSLVKEDGTRWTVPGRLNLHVGGDQHNGLDKILTLSGGRTIPTYQYVSPVVE